MTNSVPFEHITVLREELLDSLGLTQGDYAVDCTAGGGGHTQGLLERVGPPRLDGSPVAHLPRRVARRDVPQLVQGGRASGHRRLVGVLREAG